MEDSRLQRRQFHRLYLFVTNYYCIEYEFINKLHIASVQSYFELAAADDYGQSSLALDNLASAQYDIGLAF